MHVLNLNVISSKLESRYVLEFGCFRSRRTELEIFSGELCLHFVASRYEC